MAHERRGATVVVLGGGVGGVTAARDLRDKLSPADRVILVERSDHLTFAGTILWILQNKRDPEKLTRPYDDLAKFGIEFRRAEVTRLDFDQRTVRTSGGDIQYDYLVIALGAELHMEALPGLAEAALNLYSPPEVVRLREVLSFFAGGRVVLAVSRMPFKCPAAPYEAALLVENLLCQHQVRERSVIELYTPEPMPIGAAGKQAADRLTEFLQERGIHLHVNHELESVDPGTRQLRFKDGKTASYDLLAAVPPHTPPAAVRESAVAGPGGWMPADNQTLATSVERVYAVGDVASVTLPSGRPLPKAAIFARRAAEVVAHNIGVQVRGRGHIKTFTAIGGCQMETGDGRAFSVEGNFSAAPEPAVELKGPALRHHYEKVYLERSVLNML
jgi:sulfide:quinone oxidoreductase